MARPEILDAWGRPIRREKLGQELAAPRVGTMRSPAAGYQGDGLNPVRLAAILRAADAGEPRQFLELAETIEERDPHYLGVLGTRRRSVAQLDITVEAASDSARDEEIAQMVREYVERDELVAEIFNILDCLGKGYSGTEIVYETSEGQYRPRLVWRDPRSFRFDRNDLETPMLISESGQPIPMEPGRFIWATIKAKSGLALRSGLGRVAAWGYMFKKFTERDWAIFTQTYGQPVRIGKYGAGATEEEKSTLFQAVANIAGDCAAIIPESMQMDFVEAANVGAAHQLYKERADWIDQQISKAVLGQTSTTDAVVGGLGSGKEHREVQEDIETSDARALAAILNRDLVRVWVQLEYGPQKAYPRIRIGRPDQTDLKALSDALGPMIDRGLEVDMADLRTRFGLPEPKPGAALMRPATPKTAPTDPSGDPGAVPPDATSKIKRDSGEIKRGNGVGGSGTAPQSEGASAAKSGAPGAVDLLTARLALEASPAMEAMLGRIEAMIDAAGSLEELAVMVREGFPDVDDRALAGILAQAFVAAHLGGRATTEDAGSGS